MKRVIALILSLVMLLSLVPTTAWAEEMEQAQDDGASYEFAAAYVAEEDLGVSNEALHAAYIQRVLDESVGLETPMPFRTSALKAGTLEKEIYDALKVELAKIAAGTRTSTEITISGLTGSWSAEDLGVEAIFDDTGFTEDARIAIFGDSTGNEKGILGVVYDCLLADCPLELYWHDKTDGVAFGARGIMDNGAGEVEFSSVTFKFCVATDYSVDKAVKTFVTDSVKTKAAANAVETAQSIVDSYATKSNYDKLDAYRKIICDLVSYNNSAASGNSTTMGINPWQIIYVFDEDNTTNVVCEGYAKAFQYLCDLSTFLGDVECHTVSGTMDDGTGAGRHMWNVVTMEDGKNYLVDVTNCDSGTIGADRELFMATTANTADSHQTHTFAIGSQNVVFTYGEDMADLFCDGYLALAAAPYGTEKQPAAVNVAGSNSGQAGETVGVVLRLSGTALMGLEAKLAYSDMLEFISCTAVNNNWNIEYNEADGTLVANTVTAPIFRDTELVSLKFRVKDTAAVGGNWNVTFSDITVSDGDADDDSLEPVSWTGKVIAEPVVKWGMMEGEELPSVWEKGSMDEAMAYANGRSIGEVAYIQLINDVKTTAPLVFEDGRTTVLDLNGYDIDRGLTEATVEGNVLDICSNLTLCDTSKNADGRITGGYNIGKGGGVYLSGGTLTMNGGYITGNKAIGDTWSYGGGVYVSQSTFTMNGGTISGNTSSREGGGVYVYHGDFILNDGSISRNTVIDQGSGGVGVNQYGTFTMNGGYISENIGDDSGGVLVYGGIFTMNDGVISKNVSGFKGGGVDVVSGAFTMKDGTISENRTTGYGGGVYVGGGGNFTMSGGAIMKNAANLGAGVNVGSESSFIINGGAISENTASYTGGGVNIHPNGTFTMNDGAIRNNTVNSQNVNLSGGGVYVWDDAIFSMSGGAISGNNANYNGGGVYVSGTLQLYGTPNISNNTYGKGSAAKSSNVCINPDGAVYLMDALGESAAIGVTTMATPMGDAPVMVALGGGDPAHIPTADDAAKFTSDEGHVVQLASHEGGAAIVLMPVPVATLGKTSGSLNLFEDTILTIPVECNYPILSAQFVNEDLDEVFNLAVTEDGVQITSKGDKPEHVTWSAWGKELAGTYKSAIDIEYSDGSYCTTAQTLSIKLTAAAPKVTAAALKFNSFYLNETQQLVFTTKDGVVDHIAVDESKATDKAPACPSWLTLNENQTVTLDNSKLVNNKGSGKLNLEVWLEGYRAPAQVAVSVSVAYTAPKLKLSATSLSLSNNTVPEGVPMTLLSADKKFSLADLNVTSLRAANDDDLAAMSEKDRKTYAGSTAIGIVDFDSVTGAFNLTVNGRLTNGKVLLIATIGDNSEQEVNISLTIKVMDRATLKASATKITLNTAMGTGEIHDEKIVTFSTNVQGFWFGAADWSSITDASGHDCSGELDIPLLQTTRADFALSFRANEKTVEGKTYKVTVYVEGTAKPVVINVTAKALVPTVKLSTKSLSLHQNNGIGTITVSGLKGYDVSDLVVDAPSAVSVGGDSEAITFELTNRAELGKTYKVNISYELACGLRTKPVAISVKAVDKITATASVKGNMDVTRPDTTSSNFTFKYTGWYPGKDFSHDPVLEWKVYAKNGKKPIDSSDYPIDPVKGSLVSYGSIDNVSKSEGWFENVSTEPYGVKLAINAYGDRAWNDGEINPKYTYNVYFTLTFHNDIGTTEDDIIVELKPVKMTVKQGSVKFAASTNTVTLSKTADAVSDAFTIYSTDKDKEYVAGIAKVDFVRSTLADGLVLDYQWNEETMGYDCTLAWAEGIPVTAKSSTVKLNIYLTGSTGVKPNATVSLKVNMK